MKKPLPSSSLLSSLTLLSNTKSPPCSSPFLVFNRKSDFPSFCFLVFFVFLPGGDPKTNPGIEALGGVLVLLLSFHFGLGFTSTFSVGGTAVVGELLAFAETGVV